MWERGTHASTSSGWRAQGAERALARGLVGAKLRSVCGQDASIFVL